MTPKPTTVTRLIALACLLVLACTTRAEDKPQIRFLVGDEAEAAIVDESIEPYFALLCLHEMQVKAGIELEGDDLDAQREAFKAHYAKHVSEFNDQEKDLLNEVIGLVYEALAEDYPGFVAYPWSLIKTTDDVEQGLPHTRGKSIILPEGFLGMAMRRAEANKNDAMFLMINLMVHEQIHVAQRLDPEPFYAFYTEHWGLKRVEKIVYGDYLNDRQLINPDGVDTRWVQNIGTEGLPRYIQPNIILQRFEDRASRMPQDFKQVAIELKQDKDGVWRPIRNENGRPIVRPLHDVEDYMSYYGGSTNVYHPNESFADLFAMAVLYDSFIPANAIKPEQRAAISKTFDPVRKLMREAYGETKD